MLLNFVMNLIAFLGQAGIMWLVIKQHRATLKEIPEAQRLAEIAEVVKE